MVESTGTCRGARRDTEENFRTDGLVHAYGANTNSLTRCSALARASWIAKHQVFSR